MPAVSPQPQAAFPLVKFVIFAALTIGLVVKCVTATAVEVLRSPAPERALMINPDDGRSIVNRNDGALAATLAMPDPSVLVRDGRHALMDATLNSGAVRMLGLAAQARGDQGGAERLFELASRISRRDLLTQLQLIELSVQHKDVGRALTHYDIALKIYVGAERVLFPVLTNAIESPPVREAFSPILAERPPWLGSFLEYAIHAGGHSAAVASLLGTSAVAKAIDRSGMIDARLMQGLAADRQFDRLHQHYLAIAGTSAAAMTASQFSAENVRADLAPISWQIIPSPQLQANFVEADRGGDGFDLSVALDPGNRVLVMRKTMFLPPATYRFRAAIAFTSWSPDSSAGWLLKCATTGAEPILWQAVAGKAEATTIAGAPVVDRNCPVQFLDLVVTAGGQGTTPLQMTIGSPLLSTDQKVTASSPQR